MRVTSVQVKRAEGGFSIQARTATKQLVVHTEVHKYFQGASAMAKVIAIQGIKNRAKWALVS